MKPLVPPPSLFFPQSKPEDSLSGIKFLRDRFYRRIKALLRAKIMTVSGVYRSFMDTGPSTQSFLFAVTGKKPNTRMI